MGDDSIEQFWYTFWLIKAISRNSLIMLLRGGRHDLQTILTPHFLGSRKAAFGQTHNSAFVRHPTVSSELRCFGVQSGESPQRRREEEQWMNKATGSFVRWSSEMGRRARFRINLSNPRFPILILLPVR